MTTKLEKMLRRLNEEFREVLAAEMRRRYKIEIETNYNFISGKIVSTRVDEKDFTPEQRDFMNHFGDGYAAAMGIVREESNKS